MAVRPDSFAHFVVSTRDRIAFSIKYHRDFYLSGFFTLAGVALAVASPPPDAFGWAGLILTLIGAVAWVCSFLAANRDRGALIVQERALHLADLPLAEAAARIDCEVLWHGSEIAIVRSDDVDRLLWTQHPAVELMSTRYRLPQLQRLIFPQVFAIEKVWPHDWNEAKVKLTTDLSPGFLAGGQPVHVQRTDYYSNIITNNQCDRTIRGEESERLFDGVSYFLDEDGGLVGLGESTASNGIGISSLCITSDFQVIYQTQGKQREAPNAKGPSGSGSLDWADLVTTVCKRGGTFVDAVIFGMEREQNEEIGVPHAQGKVATALTGYGRYLHRGGKPEFFGISVTSARRQELSPGKLEGGRVRCIHSIPLDRIEAGHVADRLESQFASWRGKRDVSRRFS